MLRFQPPGLPCQEEKDHQVLEQISEDQSNGLLSRFHLMWDFFVFLVNVCQIFYICLALILFIEVCVVILIL